MNSNVGSGLGKFVVIVKDMDDIDAHNMLDEMAFRAGCESYLDDENTMYITGPMKKVVGLKEKIYRSLKERVIVGEKIEEDAFYSMG